MIEVACDAGAPRRRRRSRRRCGCARSPSRASAGSARRRRWTLEPQPGLTVVVGRNGSGKSSFAEGLELLMTGRLKRWEKRPKAWTETWQCLHHDGPTRLVGGAGARRRRDGRPDAGVGARARRTTTRAAAPPAAAAARRARLGPRPALVPPVPRLRRAGDDVRHALLALRGADAGARPRRHRRARGVARAGRGWPTTTSARRSAAHARRWSPGWTPTTSAPRSSPPRVGAGKPDLDAIAQLLADAPDYSGDTALLRRLAGPRAADRRGDPRGVQGAPRRRARARRRRQDRRRARDQPRRAAAPRARGPRPAKLTDDCPVCGTPDVLDDAWAPAGRRSRPPRSTSRRQR